MLVQGNLSCIILDWSRDCCTCIYEGKDVHDNGPFSSGVKMARYGSHRYTMRTTMCTRVRALQKRLITVRTIQRMCKLRMLTYTQRISWPACMRLNTRVRVCLLEGLLVRACMHEVEYSCTCLRTPNEYPGLRAPPAVQLHTSL